MENELSFNAVHISKELKCVSVSFVLALYIHDLLALKTFRGK